ncbi:MAG TPA: aminopeptidase P N-terminal domain-containing protein [Gemmatimonadota bacterium]|nr:aminopeptidase P N-terminal domain-containing protein [Gemmatimonadota bacterium]
MVAVIMRVFLSLVLLAGAAPALAQAPAGPPEWPGAGFFAAHRQAFMERMEGGIAIFAAQPEIPRNDDAGYPYRQDSDFWYLTGFEEPESVAILRPEAPEGQRFALFVRARDLAEETWTGYRAGVEGAREIYGADVAYVIDSLDQILPRLLEGESTVYWDSSNDHPWAQEGRRRELEQWVEADPSAARRLLGTDAILDELRLIKSEEEVGYLQQAIDLTAAAHRAAMAAIRPGMHEYEVEALIEYVFRAHGSQRVGFQSIVGSGPNATTLHYEENQRRMDGSDMVVMDIGAEWNYYTADVTRTVPVDGEFSAEERAIYQIVLDAQQAGIDLVGPGVGIREVHAKALEVVTEGLIQVGLLSGTVEENLASGAYRKFFMHGTSHWLGLDVHDVGSYAQPGVQGTSRVLRPGMVLTVEPGVYIRDGAEGVDPKWWNIGIRIEDDVLVTEDGYRIMSTSPRTIEEIEEIMVERGLPDVVP